MPDYYSRNQKGKKVPVDCKLKNIVRKLWKDYKFIIGGWDQGIDTTNDYFKNNLSYLTIND